MQRSRAAGGDATRPARCAERLRADEIAAVEPGKRTRAALHRDRRPRTHAPAQPFLECGAVRLRSAGRIDERSDVLGDGIGERDRQHLAPRREDQLLRQSLCRLFELTLRDRFTARQRHDLERSGAIGIVDRNMHHEAVDLRFGQWKRAFLLDGILGRHHEKQRAAGCRWRCPR